MYIVGRPIICDVSFCFILEVLVTNRAAHSSCTAAVSAQQPEEHVKNTLQNITTEWTPHSVNILKCHLKNKCASWKEQSDGQIKMSQEIKVFLDENSFNFS